MDDRYGIRRDYVARGEPSYDDQFAVSAGYLYQPDVYLDAAAFADRLDAPAIVDVGSGNGEKLMAASGGRQAIGLDFGSNLESCARRFPQAVWRCYDADSQDALPITRMELAGAVIVCADVVEHLRHPERLLRALRASLDKAVIVVLSTPDRERLWGPNHLGPPSNPFHVREWSRSELASLLRDAGFTHGAIRWTREHDRRHDLRCIEAVLSEDAAVLDRLGLGGPEGIRLVRPAVPASRRAAAIARRGQDIAKRFLSHRPTVSAHDDEEV